MKKRANTGAAAGWAVLFCSLAALAGCATYTPLPLDTAPPLASSWQQLRHPGISLRQPLPVQDITYLAVENNPDLRAARARVGVAEAQVLQAGLLPNPVFSGNLTPIFAGPGTTTAWSAGLTEDVVALITLSARRQSARASALQVNADLLWQEWQVIAKARLVSVDLIEGQRMMRLLVETRDLLAGRYARARQALAQGNTVLTTVTPDLVALDAMRRQILDLDRVQATRWHDLDALLGLAPAVRPPLGATIALPSIDVDAVRRALPQLADRRPDLIALQLGYRAQEAKIRAAILSQFPALALGPIAGRDTTDVRTVGPQVTLDLPIFNHNQGNVAIERATRAQLHAEFTARLASADGQVEAALADIALLRTQIRNVRGQLATAVRVAGVAQAAFRAGNLDERSYVDLVLNRLDKQQELVQLEQSLLDLWVATATLVGAGMPAVMMPGAVQEASVS